MACECVGDDLLFRYEVSGQGASCGVSQMGGGPPISNNHIVINLDENDPDCVKLEFTRNPALLAMQPRSDTWICQQSPAPGGSNTLVWARFHVPRPTGTYTLFWSADAGQPPCPIKITIKRV